MAPHESPHSSAITIVGAGPGGLTLARILALHGVACEVFDADRNVNSRHQGGMLNINEDSGLGALRAAGLYDEFRSHVIEGAEATRILDKFGNVLLDHSGGGGRPEIDRGSLRKILAASLADGVIHWNAKVTSLTPVTGGGFRMEFADGRTAVARTIVGADGPWSKVRPLVSVSKPEYCGITFAELRLSNASTRHPEAARIVGNGLVFALSDERGFIGHREPNDELCVYAAFKAPEDWHGQTITREMLQEKFRDWHPAFLKMIEHREGEVPMRPLYALPIRHRWNRVPGVTLLGDAAHLMSPFAGEGVNLAMMDAADLAESIVVESDIEAALAAYESKMFARAEEAAAESAKNLEVAFAPDSPKELLALFAGFGISQQFEAQRQRPDSR